MAFTELLVLKPSQSCRKHKVELRSTLFYINCTLFSFEGKKARGNLFGGAFKLRETNVFNRLLLI